MTADTAEVPDLVTYRRILEVQTRLLAAHLLGEVPSYTAFCTR